MRLRLAAFLAVTLTAAVMGCGGKDEVVRTTSRASHGHTGVTPMQFRQRMVDACKHYQARNSIVSSKAGPVKTPGAKARLFLQGVALQGELAQMLDRIEAPPSLQARFEQFKDITATRRDLTRQIAEHLAAHGTESKRLMEEATQAAYASIGLATEMNLVDCTF